MGGGLIREWAGLIRVWAWLMGGVVVSQVEINIELTAEEWRRRHDKIKENNIKLKATIER